MSLREKFSYIKHDCRKNNTPLSRNASEAHLKMVAEVIMTQYASN